MKKLYRITRTQTVSLVTDSPEDALALSHVAFRGELSPEQIQAQQGRGTSDLKPIVRSIELELRS